jgi:hypothetical protein
VFGPTYMRSQYPVVRLEATPLSVLVDWEEMRLSGKAMKRLDQTYRYDSFVQRRTIVDDGRRQFNGVGEGVTPEEPSRRVCQ